MILTPEYQLHAIATTGETLMLLGPYDSLEEAEGKKHGGEQMPHLSGVKWIIMERAVTQWDPVANPSNWPEED
jgi:hypothetical protein